MIVCKSCLNRARFIALTVALIGLLIAYGVRADHTQEVPALVCADESVMNQVVDRYVAEGAEAGNVFGASLITDGVCDPVALTIPKNPAAIVFIRSEPQGNDLYGYAGVTMQDGTRAYAFVHIRVVREKAKQYSA